jgi:hypothetical protein
LAAAFSLATLPGCSCVARGTKVLTPDGSRAIEDLKVVDVVLAVDTSAGVLHPVSVLFVRSSRRECLRLVWDKGALTCTSDHPIYSPERGSFVEAGNWLTDGLRRLLAWDGEVLQDVEVVAVEAYAGIHEVFDVGVEGPWHDFIADGVVVHNKEPVLYSYGYAEIANFNLSSAVPTRELRVHFCIEGAEDITKFDAVGSVVTSARPLFDLPDDVARVTMTMLWPDGEGIVDDSLAPGTLHSSRPLPLEACAEGVRLAWTYTGPAAGEVAVHGGVEMLTNLDVYYDDIHITVEEE